MNFTELLNHKPGEVRKITSSANVLVKTLRSLRLKKYRAISGLFLAEGARTLIEALELGHKPLAIAYLSSSEDEPPVSRIRQAVKKAGGLGLEVSAEVLNKLSSRDNPQTVIGLFRQRWQEINSLPRDLPQVLVLEDVRDPGNLGTIFRTCDGFGVTHVILAGDTTDPYGLEAVRASMGSIFSVHLTTASLDDLLNWLTSWPGETIGTALEGAQDIREAKWRKPHVLLMGNEQKGLSEKLKQRCTQRVKIPMRGRADSFNLAVATGVALYLASAE